MTSPVPSPSAMQPVTPVISAPSGQAAASPVLMTTPRRAAVADPDWACSFKFPWETLPSRVLTQLRSGKRLKADGRRLLVRAVVAEVRKVCDRPWRRQMAFVAQKMVQSYPQSLKEELGGDTVGSGYDSLLSQLMARVENEHRGLSKTHVANDNSASEVNQADQDEPQVRKKRSAANSYGCVQWQPSGLPDGETKESQQVKQAGLRELFETLPWDIEAIRVLMKLTYTSQRRDINGGMTAAQLKCEWPFLFEPVGLLAHASELLEFDVRDVMTESLTSKGPRILGYLSSLKKSSVVQLIAAMNEAKGSMGNNGPEAPAIILALMATFSEDAAVLLKTVDVSFMSCQHSVCLNFVRYSHVWITESFAEYNYLCNEGFFWITT